MVVVPSRLDAACPTGWKEHNDNCYKKVASAQSWNDAKVSCEVQEATLAEVKGEAENKFVKDTFGGNNWLGLSRCHTSSTCLLDFSPALWTNWAPGQPDKLPQYPPGQRNKDFAVVIQASGEWTDQPKLEKRSYICKKPADPCEGNFCNPEGSTCVDGKCQCTAPYSGEYCYVLPCDDEPCLNGGTCEDTKDGYKCTCMDHYSGKNCEVPPPCKTKNPCKNGVCQDISSVEYRCKCNHGWIGKNCTERPCDSKPCSNAKKCIDKGFKYECVCEKGWTGQNCDKDGYAGGDPHYRTFDGKSFDFMGKCEYIYAKDCTIDHAFEVLQQNEACGRSASCTKSIRVLVQGIEIKMERGGIVYVDGNRVKLPWKMSRPTIPPVVEHDVNMDEISINIPRSVSDPVTTITSYSWRRGAFLNVPALLFSVRWDGSTVIVVKINQRYKNKTCGLMGNADSNPNNDFRLPDGSFTNNIAEFANSWKKNPHCVNGVVPPDPCTRLSTSKYNEIRQKCGKMKQAPFQQCNGRINPDKGHIPDCEYDMCAMKAINPTAAWCQALETYDRACRSNDLNINWEGQAGFEECGNPCSNIPCFNGATCTNINTTDFKCICPTGFSGPTCENVDCKPGYKPHGNLCYKRMGRRPWAIAKCQRGDEFVSAENEDENRFIYDTFVKPSKKPFWMHARICGERKLCQQDYGPVFYNNVEGGLPSSGCVQLPYGKGMKWVVTSCKAIAFYVCKYEKF
mgnify:FL=1